MRPIRAILAEHPGEWVVLVLGEGERGRFVTSAKKAEHLALAIQRERAAGRETGIFYTGPPLPDGAMLRLRASGASGAESDA